MGICPIAAEHLYTLCRSAQSSQMKRSQKERSLKRNSSGALKPQMLIDAIQGGSPQYLKCHHGHLIHLCAIFCKCKNIINRAGHNRAKQGG